VDISVSTSVGRLQLLERLEKLARLRRALAPLVLLLPVTIMLVVDLWWRGARLWQFDAWHWATYGAAFVESLVVWASLLLAASRRSSVATWFCRVAFVLLFTICVGGQSYFFQQYNAYLNADVSRFATDFFESVLNQLWADAGNYLSVKGPVFVLAVVLLMLAHKIVRPSRSRGRIATIVAPLAVVASLFIPTQHQRLQASTPDVLYLNAMGGMLRTLAGFTEQSHQLRPRARKSLAVPALVPRIDQPRNVVFVILESVRADAACVTFIPGCKRTAATNQLFPGRVPLRQLRALDSSTAISLAVLWTGVGPHESRDVLHSWPLIFDYAKAAGYYTAFWTSQNMMFGNVRLWVDNLGADSFFHGTDVDPTSDIDLGAPENLFAERGIAEVARLHEPYFLTIQLSNGHYPYLVDPEGPQPFQPAEMSKAPEDNKAFYNFYQNAVHQQDQHLGRLLRAIKQAPGGDRTVVVYTSDHGEAFREHYQMGHTFSVYDEEIKVPGFIDAPPGVLTDEQMVNLRAKSDAFTFHPDLTATVLDLLGVWHDPALVPFRQKMLGVSLLGAEPNPRALPLTNCAGVWSCAFENWGYMQGSNKLAARAWDSEYRCYDLDRDPKEQHDLGAAHCGDLRAQAGRLFGRLPGKKDD